MIDDFAVVGGGRRRKAARSVNESERSRQPNFVERRAPIAACCLLRLRLRLNWNARWRTKFSRAHARSPPPAADRTQHRAHTQLSRARAPLARTSDKNSR